MAQITDHETANVEWKGQFSNASPHAIDTQASQVQVNIGEVSEGRLDVRSGLRKVVFAN